MGHFLQNIDTLKRAIPYQHNVAEKTLTLEVSPGHVKIVDFPLRPGTFEHLADDEIREVALFLKLKGRRSTDTLRRYTSEIEKFLVFLRVAQHHVINEWVLMEYQECLLEPTDEIETQSIVTFNSVTPETADQYLNVIRSFSQYLTDKNLLSYNPAKQVPGIGIKEKDALSPPKCFSNTQWPAVLDTLTNLPERTPGQRNRKARLRFCILFSYATGMRVSEAAKHTHTHVIQRSNRWTLKIIGKGMRARSLSLEEPDTIGIEELTRYRIFLGLCPTPNQESLPLLPKLKPVRIGYRGPKKGIHINASAISRTTWEEQFKSFLRNDVMTYLYGNNDILREEAFGHEWAHLTPHSLRHTRITHLVEQGHNLFWIQQFAGHENLDTTRRYFHSGI